MKKAKSVFVCGSCGYQSVKWFGRCPVCDAWNTFEEETVSGAAAQGSPTRAHGPSREACPVGQVDAGDGDRLSLGDEELDLLFGGGVVQGSAILIGGEPGIGKSTFLTQIAAYFAANYAASLYVTGEESLQQVRLRAERIDAVADDFYLLAENSFSRLQERVKKTKPKLLIVDSIQTLMDEELDSIPGSIGQIRECTAKLLRMAKNDGITVMIAGHVTKEGVIAGPRLLEHMVDVVLYFEGERHQGFRILRSVKNRFGSTNEVALLDMTEKGLLPFHNPSAVFLERRGADAAGSAIGAVMEGTRSFLLEIQALVTHSSFGNPRRVANGIEYNRLLLIIAVLEKILGLPLGSEDVYLNVTGGLKLDDTGSDLAVAAAIVSGFRNLTVRRDAVLLGEIGLGGELRGAGQLEKHIREGMKFGFTCFIVPAYLYKGSVREVKGAQVIPARTVKEALSHIFVTEDEE